MKVVLERNLTINRILAPEHVPNQLDQVAKHHVNIPKPKGFSDEIRIKERILTKGNRGTLAINQHPEIMNIEIPGSRI